ncbi:MAG: nucleotidyl transferase AbiEii/AbiGii toxin family protein [Pseudolysinimonas sp.]|uniref:nucleotidyl transferase AbiEii/AbiGii toxin family protein n=1 Tax=Pseudolysinimonas sp. TaxID=2680009 RepID=UPI003C7642DC
MAGDEGYETPAAVRSALTTAVKLLPQARRGAALREFVHDRFLCRVFALKEPWVLKGGTAMLARVADARHTKDVDLWNETRDMDLALASIHRAIDLDLGDHLADKVCAIHELHNDNPSTRVRDLVDVLVYAATESVDGAALRVAIASEALHRGMGPIITFAPPSTWAGQFAKVARDAEPIIGRPSFAEAVESAAAFIQPALARDHSGTWSPTDSSWN